MPTIQSACSTWKRAPDVEPDDPQNDPWEFSNLAEFAYHPSAKKRLLSELQIFRELHDDRLLDRETLRHLISEHDNVASATKWRI